MARYEKDLDMNKIIDRLYTDGNLQDSELKKIITVNDNTYLASMADRRRREFYGDAVFVRGLIEVSNFCRNNCYYCGIRAENKNLSRYRLTKEEILLCCEEGYNLGLRTFVLQGGEDSQLSDKIICDVVSKIKNKYPDCAVTLSLGEKEYNSYKAFYDAGADR